MSLSSTENVYRLSVQDNGSGIDVSYQPFLFKKFTQEQSSGTRNVGGTGLGLAVSKGFVEQLGGTLSYTTTSKGTTLYVDIPIKTLFIQEIDKQSHSA